MAIIFFALHGFVPTLPWYGDIALLVVTYFITGRFAYNFLRDQINSTPIAIIVFFVSASLLWYIVTTQGVVLNLQKGTIPDPWWVYIVPTLGFLMVWGVSYVIKEHGWKLSSVFVWLGSNSLLIMCLHEPIKRIVIKICQIVFHYAESDSLRENLLMSLLVVVLTFGICYPLSIAVIKWVPWMAGKFKPNKAQ